METEKSDVCEDCKYFPLHRIFDHSIKEYRNEKYCRSCLAVRNKEMTAETRDKEIEFDKQNRYENACSQYGKFAIDVFKISTFKASPNNADSIEFLKNFDPETQNVFIHGPCGTGKTHLGFGVFRLHRHLNGHSENPAFLTLSRLNQLCRAKEGWQEAKLVESFAKKSPLFFDDVGAGKMSEFTCDILLQILDKRILHAVHGLIITSNLSLDQIAKKQEDDRFSSRIAGLCKIIKLDGEDYRLKKPYGGQNAV